MCAYELVQNDLKALRGAERIGFYLTNGAGCIRCFKDIPDDVWGTTQMEYKIETESGIGYPSSYTAMQEKLCEFTCYELIWQYKMFPSNVKTIISHLRAGDTLRLIWGENGAGYTSDRRLYLDMLYLEVTHKNGKQSVYLLAVGVCPDNWARMIRKA